MRFNPSFLCPKASLLLGSLPPQLSARVRRLPRAAKLLCICLVLALLPSTSAIAAQNAFTRVYGSADRAVPMPAFTGTLGQKDAGALQEFIDYLKAVSVSGWQGMRASGTLTDSAGNSGQATLTILNGDQFRLDVQTPKGQRSMRISGNSGKTLEADGKSFLMPPATARAGLLAFPQLLVAAFPSSRTSLIDRGLVQLDGVSLHRVTLEQPVFPDAARVGGRDISVTDLYFDPSTHLLLKSASAVQLDPADRERYLIVVSYGDYQSVQGGLLPCRYSQSMNGQPQWILQLSAPALQPSVDPSYFHF